MGDYGLAHEVGTLLGYTDDLHSIRILQVIHIRDCPVTWSASLYSIGPGSQVYSLFFGEFQRAMGTQLMLSITFHPQTDGQSKKFIQTLEDMLQACVLTLKGGWEENLLLVEFSYNNNYQASMQMTPYEALYGRPCRSLVCWTEVGETSSIGPDLVKDTSEKVDLIRRRLLTAQSR